MSDSVQQNSTYPDAGYPDRLGSSGKFVQEFYKTWLEITGYQIRYNIMAFRTSNQAWSTRLDEGTCCKYEGWNFNSGNYLFTTDAK